MDSIQPYRSLFAERGAATSFQPAAPAAYCAVTATKSIVLIGMMGAGKSSVGRALQRRTGLARIDTDELVTSQFGISVAEIFKMHGEDKFRNAETEAIRKLAPERPTIITTGGGAVLRRENVDLLKKLGTIFWLAADEGTLFERASRRDERPLLQNENPREVFSKLLRERETVYAAAADFRIETARKSHDEVANAILNKLETVALQ